MYKTIENQKCWIFMDCPENIRKKCWAYRLNVSNECWILRKKLENKITWNSVRNCNNCKFFNYISNRNNFKFF